MSEEQLKAFISKVQSDESLLNKLKAEGADVLAIAKEAGFNFTSAQLIRFQAQSICELSDEELENAGGGMMFSKGCTHPIACVVVHITRFAC